MQEGRWLGTAGRIAVVGDASELRLAERGPRVAASGDRTRARRFVEAECRFARPGDVRFAARRKRLTEESVRWALGVYHSSAPIGRRGRAVAGAQPTEPGPAFAVRPAVKDIVLVLGLDGHRHPARIVCNPGAHHGGAVGCTSGLVAPACRRVNAPGFEWRPAFVECAQPPCGHRHRSQPCRVTLWQIKKATFCMHPTSDLPVNVYFV